MDNNWATNQMKRKLTVSMMIIMMMTVISCKKEETPVYDNPMNHISVPRAEYKIRNNMAYAIRFSISNQSKRTLYYCKFRVNQCNDDGTAYYSKTYEVGSKEDNTQWTLAPGDIDFTPYYDCYFVFVDGEHITHDIIDAKFR